jgi:choline dehydrogenase-like flavoprotein
MKRVNAVVAGAGAAGGVIAKELSTAGLSVVLLERGKWYTAYDCRKDELRIRTGGRRSPACLGR